MAQRNTRKGIPAQLAALESVVNGCLERVKVLEGK